MTPKSQSRERIRFDDNWRFQLGDLPFSSPRFPITHWFCKPVGTKRPAEGPSQLKKLSVEKGKSWKKVLPKKDVFNEKPGFAWFKTSLPDIPGPGRNVHFTSVSDDCTVYLNGKKLLSHERWIDAFDVPLDPAWNETGPNHLLVLVQNTYGGGFIAPAELETEAAQTYGPALEWFDDKIWREVHLPHDFVVEGRFDSTLDDYNGYLKPGIGWYRKTFDIPLSDQGRSLWLDFDGIFRNSRVWLNGRFLGRHRSGYTPSRYDITDLVRHGEKNTLAVRVDARAAEGWWYEGGGIYRHVWLNKADPLHVVPWGVQVISKPNGKSADIEIKTTLVNRSYQPADFKLHSEVKDAKDRSVLNLFTSSFLRGEKETTLVQKGKISSAVLWSLENPHLYRLVTTLRKNGEIVDKSETSFGVRSIRFDANKGFFLNGKSVKLKGTCNHQDHAGLGVALPDRLFTYRLEKLKAMGSNAYRCAHHPHAAELLDACDRLGILAVDENRRLDDTPDVLEQAKTMVLRDRNHPSVILWSICNEEPRQGTPIGQKRGQALKETILKYDRTRPITAAVNYAFDGGIRKVVDVEGINYNINQYQDFRKKFPKTPMFGSETASTLCSRGIYETNPSKGYVSAYDVNHTMWSLPAEAAWRPVAERDFLAGAFIWTGFDYRGEPTPYKWPCINSHFGILDTCGYPKDNFYYYKAWWGNETILHLFPHWNWKGKEGKEIEVWCHGNCDRVELFLNGVLIGTKEIPRYGHLDWKVKYAPGVLLAKGWKDGKVVIESKVETTGKPCTLNLVPYNSQLKADGEDVIPVQVEILDAKGRLVPTANNLVTFKVSGPAKIAGVGNGNPSSHEPDKASQRRAFNGLCAVFVGAGKKTGKVTLTAQAKGLRKASISLFSK